MIHSMTLLLASAIVPFLAEFWPFPLLEWILKSWMHRLHQLQPLQDTKSGWNKYRESSNIAS
jgi:hypothetical protein